MPLTTVQQQQLRAYRPTETRWCTHAASCRLRRVPGEGRLALVLHCTTCGASGVGIPRPKVGIGDDEAREIPERDEQIAVRWKALQDQRRAERKTQHDRDSEEIYKSEWWKVVVQLVRERCGGTCERCRTRPMVTAHHKRYLVVQGRRVGGEPLDWLVGICSACHQPGDDSRWLPNYLGVRGPAHAAEMPHFSGR